MSGVVIASVYIARQEFAHARRIDTISDHGAAEKIFEACQDQRFEEATWRSLGHCLSDVRAMLGLNAVEAFDTFALTDLIMSNRDNDGNGSLNFKEFKAGLDSICRKF